MAEEGLECWKIASISSSNSIWMRFYSVSQSDGQKVSRSFNRLVMAQSVRPSVSETVCLSVTPPVSQSDRRDKTHKVAEGLGHINFLYLDAQQTFKTNQF